MTTLFIQAISKPQAVARIKDWIPELVGVTPSLSGVQHPEQILFNQYTGNYYVHKGPSTFLRRRPKGDEEFPPSFFIEDVITIQSVTPAGDAILNPIHEELYRRCLRRMKWRTWSFTDGLRAVPIHTHDTINEQLDERIAWQLVGEEVDGANPKSREQLRGVRLRRSGVRVTFTHDDKIELHRRGGKAALFSDVTA